MVIEFVDLFLVCYRVRDSDRDEQEICYRIGDFSVVEFVTFEKSSWISCPSVIRVHGSDRVRDLL